MGEPAGLPAAFAESGEEIDHGERRTERHPDIAGNSAVNNWSEMGRWESNVCRDPQMLRRELEWIAGKGE